MLLQRGSRKLQGIFAVLGVSGTLIFAALNWADADARAHVVAMGTPGFALAILFNIWGLLLG